MKKEALTSRSQKLLGEWESSTILVDQFEAIDRRVPKYLGSLPCRMYRSSAEAVF